MALSDTGLSVDSFEEVLAKVVTREQEIISSQINTAEDTSLGQLNAIMSEEISSVNELLQDIYDQRDIYKAEGKALDDNVSWLGVSRQSAAATSGQTTFTGQDGTVLPTGSLVRNESTLENYSLDTAVQITKDACRSITVSVQLVDDASYDYTVTTRGIPSVYTSQTSDTATEIIAGLVAQIALDTDSSYAAVDNGDDTLTVSVSDQTDAQVSFDVNLTSNSVVVVGSVTGVNTGSLPAPANTVTKILSPTGGWFSTNNTEALIIGREQETDAELRSRALEFRSTTGKATVDAIKAEVLNVAGVASVAVNEQFVSLGDNINGQPAGSIQLVVAGGDDNDEVGTAIWDTKPAGVEVWASGTPNVGTNVTVTIKDAFGQDQVISFNRPTSEIMTIIITYDIFDSEVYPADPQDAYDAVAASVVAFGNALDAGEDVYPATFEGSVYGAVGGISNVSITINGVNSVPPTNFIPIAADEEAFFDVDNVTVTGT